METEQHTQGSADNTNMPNHPHVPPTLSHSGEDPKNKKKLLLVIILVVALLVAGGAAYMMMKDKKKDEPAQNNTPAQAVTDVVGDAFSTDPIAKGKYLSYNNCEGEGSKKLESAPMKMSDVSVILPYGLVAGGHVTPVDHQYYYGKNQSAAASTYDVLAPADGTVVSVEARSKGGNKYDYRVVISYSCTFFSYFDLVNTLSSDFAAKMPSGYETINGPQKVKIPVKKGDVLAKIGGQSLDFAVWDTTKTLSGLLVPNAYNNYEPWKVHTVKPLDYFSDAVKTEVLPYYVRSVEPRDGKLDYDVDGTASGNWFKTGTNGYIGAFSEGDWSSQTYADGHLSIAPDLYDPTGWVFSTGAINHGTQYGIKAPTPMPDKLDTTSGAVKYQLVQLEHVDQAGKKWLGATVPTSIKLSTSGASMGTVLVQLTAKREIKVEVFLGKTPAQVSAFTSAATTYTRGDDAKIMVR